MPWEHEPIGKCFHGFLSPPNHPFGGRIILGKDVRCKSAMPFFHFFFLSKQSHMFKNESIANTSNQYTVYYMIKIANIKSNKILDATDLYHYCTYREAKALLQKRQ